MTATLSFALSLFMSIALVPLLMRYASTLGMVDTPDGVRKIHTKVIPRSGGLAIAIAFFITVIYLSPDQKYLPFLAGSLVIVILGVLDDRFELAFYWKFLGQIAAILIFMSGGLTLSHIPFFADSLLPGWALQIVVFFFILAVTNAVALSDGLDGLAAGTMVVSLGLIGYLGFEANEPQIIIIAFAIIGSSLGFLRYNTHPARVFMGDTGSQFLGYAAACLAMLATQLETSPVSPLLPLLIFGLPLVDTVMVMGIRIYNKRSPFSPDKNHIHHQLMHLGFHHYEAVAIIYFIQFFLIANAFFFRYEPDTTLLALFLIFSLTFIIVMSALIKTGWKFHKDETQISNCERRNLFLRRFNWLYLYSARIISIFLCCAWLLFSFFGLQLNHDSEWLAQIVLITAFVIGIILPKLAQFNARVIGYSVSVLALYPFWLAEHSLTTNLLDVFLAGMGLFLLVSIRLTRREHFRVDNQDILILLILLSIPLLPGFSNGGIDVGRMMLRMAVMIYAIEYVINRQKGRYYLLNVGGIVSLFAIAFI